MFLAGVHLSCCGSDSLNADHHTQVSVRTVEKSVNGVSMG